MLAMLIILVTLLLIAVVFVLAIRPRLVSAAAIRADLRAQGRALELRLVDIMDRTPIKGGDVPLEEIRSALDEATVLIPKLLKLGGRSVSYKTSYAVEDLQAEVERKERFSTVLAEIRKGVENGSLGPFPVLPTMSKGEYSRLIAVLKGLPSTTTATVANGTVSVIDRGPLFPVEGRWIHCLRLDESSTRLDLVGKARYTSEIDGEICVSIAGDQAFSTAKNTVALVFEGTVVDYYNTDAASGYGDILGRRAFNCPNKAVDSEGWLVPANAKVLGLMVGNGHSSETLETLLEAGYNVVVSNDTAATAQILSEMSRGVRGTLVQGNFVSGRYRLADELRPSRHDRPLRY